MSNPWLTDSTELWDAEKNSKDVPLRNVKRWAFGMRELLHDSVGAEQFEKFLEKEYSVENILYVINLSLLIILFYLILICR